MPAQKKKQIFWNNRARPALFHDEHSNMQQMLEAITCQFGREAGAYDIFFRSLLPLYEQFQLCKLKNKITGGVVVEYYLKKPSFYGKVFSRSREKLQWPGDKRGKVHSSHALLRCLKLGTHGP